MCPHCTDPDGEPCYPQYGVAPHRGNSFGTIFHYVDHWPESFVPDPDEPECGTWFCPHCWDGMVTPTPPAQSPTPPPESPSHPDTASPLP